ncbi:MAG TPA: glycerophosphodiester phosphodiesterase family protein [Steroidobacteraceae bacterium]|nr:glycerophosphodiester phosphodiesterase family protein [Steroidobacteraceae bacterium]
MSNIIVIAHRGASGERPEHTLESYRLAIEEGADYIEPDLVMTGDGVLIARHENEIGGTTDVARHPQFAARRRTQVIDGESMTGWFTEDFTLAEIKTLRARERLPELRPQNSAFDGLFAVPTFDEILQLAADVNRRRSGANRIGVYPETKHPAHFAGIGLPLEQPVLDALQRHDYAAAGSPVFIQSFDPHNLRQLRGMTRLPLVQLLEHELGDLGVIAQYADAIGIAKSLASESGIRAAHAVNLKVHVWTFRAENEFLPEDLRSGSSAAAHGDLEAEIRRFFDRGIDGFFVDFPAIGVRVRDAYISGVQPLHQPLTDTSLPGKRLQGR